MTTASESLKVTRDSSTLRELTADRLREAILTMHFKPNQRLVERDLCEQTGVSRTSVREALRHLESEGLVERRPNKGLYVTAITVDEARQIYEVRGALEPVLGRLFTQRATEREINALAATLKKIDKAIAGNSLRSHRSHVEALDDFYDVLLMGSGNEVARRFLQTLRARITYLRSLTAAKADPARKRETLRLMREIVEAAVRRDGDEVARRCAGFVERSAAFALQVLSAELAPADATATSATSARSATSDASTRT
jgi:DNA-binding GntR family transcriptional regulator